MTLWYVLLSAALLLLLRYTAGALPRNASHHHYQVLPFSYFASSRTSSVGHSVVSGKLLAAVYLPDTYILSLDLYPHANGAYLVNTTNNILDLQTPRGGHFPSLSFCSDRHGLRHSLVLQFGDHAQQSPAPLTVNTWHTVLISVSRRSATLAVSSEAGQHTWSATVDLPGDAAAAVTTESDFAGLDYVDVFASSPLSSPAAANFRNFKISPLPGVLYPGLFVDVFQTNATLSDASPPERSVTLHPLCETEGVWRRATQIDHVFWRGSVAGCADDFVLVRFRGFLTWPEAQHVLFRAEADDGFHLTIGGDEVIGAEDWGRKHCSSVSVGARRFARGESVRFEAWYYDALGDASVALLYSEDEGVSWAPVPQEYFSLYEVPLAGPRGRSRQLDEGEQEQEQEKINDL